MATPTTASARTTAPTATAEPPARLRLFNDVLEVEDRFYILASSSLADDRRLVLKHGETFGVFDHYGDIKPIGLGEEGVYHEGTRYLSTMVLRLGTERPLYLSSTVKEDNALLAVDLTNPDVSANGAVLVPRGTLHLARTRFLWHGACYERLHVRNYGLDAVEAELALHFAADFADIFEVRGLKRPRRGRRLPDTVNEHDVVLAYEGLDKVVRRARLEFSPRPQVLSASEARFDVSLPPGGEALVTVTLTCEAGGAAPPPAAFDVALADSGRDLAAVRSRLCHVYTANEQLNDWLHRAAADLGMMTTETPYGPYPYAGVPWFSTPFGRDGLITALACLWADPDLARGVLGYLAATQADAVSPAQDAEPGKILHEARRGEMAALGEIPFGRYYGSVDATPLFILLAGAYYHRTGDRAYAEQIWPHVERALHWIDRYGDADGDGFVEYARRSPTGLVQQGWKDSHDSVFHADGRLAEAPIALCEVQGYVYAAKLGAAQLADALGRPEHAADLRRQAEALRERFEEAFWCDDLGTYALALDGQKRLCRVRTSNAGHCLYAGIARPERARRTARTLLGSDSFTGWGVRTLAATERRYNPMSYHNGSVWPHDNALIAAGFARYGLMTEATQVLTGLFDASLFVDLHRLPELFCGFPRRPGEGPTLYPVACAPQAWSAAAVYLLLQACLGLEVDGPQSRVVLTSPVLPESLPELRIRNLRAGRGTVDLYVSRHGPDDVGVNVLRREGQVQVVVAK
jgi:glycogen debranching enzyme